MIGTYAYIAAGCWMVQILLERNGKEDPAKVFKALGYGAFATVLFKLGQGIAGITTWFGLGWW